MWPEKNLYGRVKNYKKIILRRFKPNCFILERLLMHNIIKVVWLSGVVHDWEASGAVFYFDLDRRCPSEIDDVFFWFFVSHLFCSLVQKSCEGARDKETELELYAARRQCACHPKSVLTGPVVSQGGSIISMSQFLRGTKTCFLFKGNRWFLMDFYVFRPEVSVLVCDTRTGANLQIKDF